MSLMTLVRMIGVLALGWTLVAIGIGASGTRLADSDPVAVETPVRESPQVDAVPTNGLTGTGLELIDRSTGQRAPIRQPRELRWSLISVSPWRVPGGELEAVGRWINPGGADFCGWGLFRLSDGVLLGQVVTEVLPMGRPCWVPGDERTILFPAGDGRLYRCRLDPGEEEPAGRRRTTDASGRAGSPDPLVWATQPPGPGEVFLQDAVWPDAPALRKWVLVALRHQERLHGRFVYGPSRLWWLELSEDAGAIVAAGRLTATADGNTPSPGIDERFPNVAIDPAGGTRLVYLERSHRDRLWRLRSAPLELDARTARPAVVIGADAPAAGLDAGLQATPLVVSTDGATVYGLSRSGRLAALPAGGRTAQRVDRDRREARDASR
jgi:hypothetical protein